MRHRLRRHERGFTLLEVLAVVFIAAVLVSMVSLGIGGRALDDQIEEEARRLNRVYELAAEEATLTGTEIGWLRTETGYQFLSLGEDGQWAPYGAQGPLRARVIQPPIKLSVEVGEFPLPADPKKPLPQVLFLSSGELTPFAATLGAPDHPVRYRIEGEITGALKFIRVGESG